MFKAKMLWFVPQISLVFFAFYDSKLGIIEFLDTWLNKEQHLKTSLLDSGNIFPNFLTFFGFFFFRPND